MLFLFVLVNPRIYRYARRATAVVVEFHFVEQIAALAAMLALQVGVAVVRMGDHLLAPS